MNNERFSLTAPWKARPLENVLDGTPLRRQLRLPYGVDGENGPRRKP